jgi:hypothetical protein
MTHEIKGFRSLEKMKGYRKSLEDAKEDLRMAREQRDDAIELAEHLEDQIMELRRTVAGLSALCGEPFNEDDEFGLTDSIRMALKTHNGGLNAQQVKTRLEQLGYKTNSANLLASVHTILKRLALKGELDDTLTSDGKTAYRWIQKPRSITESAPSRAVREDILSDSTG